MSLFLAALLVAASDEVPFEPSPDSFADAGACKARLAQLVAEARREAHTAVEGPYSIAPGDVRAHWVDISGTGHRITEHRCLADKLSVRTWRHSMDGSENEEPRTIGDMVAGAEWLKKAPAEQK